VSQTLNGLPLPVNFAPPQAAGGLLPLTFGCSPASGAAFPIGTTTVVCTVTDALNEPVSCNFTVRVLGPPRLSTTRILAFGDSITAGEVFDTYPERLRAKLAIRYQTQTPSVVNDGLSGENAFPSGRGRLPSAIDATRAGALLLMEGTNDLNGGATGASLAIQALTDMVRLAKSRGVVVLLATIPPQRPGGVRNFTAPLVAGFNDNVRALAQSEGVPLVDIYAVMIGDLSLIGPDDLHPTVQGHEVIAQAFFNAIVKALELPPEG
jgi:lysophospholipase L1-like esterase